MTLVMITLYDDDSYHIVGGDKDEVQSNHKVQSSKFKIQS